MAYKNIKIKREIGDTGHSVVFTTKDNGTIELPKGMKGFDISYEYKGGCPVVTMKFVTQTVDVENGGIRNIDIEPQNEHRFTTEEA